MNQRNYDEIAKIFRFAVPDYTESTVRDGISAKLADYFENMVTERLYFMEKVDPRFRVFMPQEREILRESFNKKDFIRLCGVKE